VHAFTDEVRKRVGTSITLEHAVAGHMTLQALQRFAISGPAPSVGTRGGYCYGRPYTYARRRRRC
jgi:hypothetical protein